MKRDVGRGRWQLSGMAVDDPDDNRAWAVRRRAVRDTVGAVPVGRGPSPSAGHIRPATGLPAGSAHPCSQSPDLFFSAAARDVAAAKRVCAGCPSRLACAGMADETGDQWAVMGGASPAERRRARRLGAAS